jgi:hypothetical protein
MYDEMLLIQSDDTHNGEDDRDCSLMYMYDVFIFNLIYMQASSRPIQVASKASKLSVEGASERVVLD